MLIQLKGDALLGSLIPQSYTQICLKPGKPTILTMSPRAKNEKAWEGEAGHWGKNGFCCHHFPLNLCTAMDKSFHLLKPPFLICKCSSEGPL
jgi:hypothetical protein